MILWPVFVAGVAGMVLYGLVSERPYYLPESEMEASQESHGGRSEVSTLSSLILNSLRPNNGWLRSMRVADPKDHWKYYAIRCGFVVLLMLLLTIFGVHLSPRALR